MKIRKRYIYVTKDKYTFTLFNDTVKIKNKETIDIVKGS